MIMSVSNMAEAGILLAVMRKVGLNVRLDGGQLQVGPQMMLASYDVAYIKELKPALIALLAAESAPDVRSTTDITPAEKMQHRPDMTPSRVSCGTCLHFLPDTIKPAQGVGRCGVTGAGPPSGGDGYRACFPLAPRRCSTHELRNGR